jgi:hypothetical protein
VRIDFNRVTKNGSLGIGLFVLMAALLHSAPAGAISDLELWLKTGEIRLDSFFGLLTQNEEDVALALLNNEHRRERELPPLPVPPLRGQVFNNFQLIPHTQEGQLEILTYQLLDLITGLPASDPFGIAFVSYEANTDPSTPLTFIPVGTSADALNDFALSWIIAGFEPTIRATPFNAAGSPIEVISSITNDNVLVGTGLQTFTPIPEPSTLFLASTGLFSLLGVAAWRQKKKRA